MPLRSAMERFRPRFLVGEDDGDDDFQEIKE
jgi:hypothetical protein